MNNETLSESVSTHGNLSRGLADTLSEIMGRPVTHLAVISALSIEGIKLDIDTEGISSIAMEYGTHLLHKSRSEEDE